MKSLAIHFMTGSILYIAMASTNAHQHPYHPHQYLNHYQLISLISWIGYQLLSSQIFSLDINQKLAKLLLANVLT